MEDDRNEPATKGDIADLRADMRSMEGRLVSVEGRLVSVEGRLVSVEGRLVSMEDRLVETLRDTQTEMLKAFYNFATTTDVKLK